MLGFSLSKILFTIAMIMAVLWVYRKINSIGTGEPKSRVKADRKKKREDPAQARSTDVEDLSACPACGSYVAAGSNPGCGRAAKDCPMQK